MKLTRILLASAMTLGLMACATISEDQCLAGNWAEIGYSDGAKGKASSRIGKIAESCSKYGVSADHELYLANYKRGIETYCTYERGYDRGASGERYNQACSGELAAEFAQGYDKGAAVYKIRREHHRLVENYKEGVYDLRRLRQALTEEDLSNDDRKRLQRRIYRLDNYLDDLRYDIRVFERRYGLSRRSLRY